jgi:hypothetical protein
MKRQDTGKIGCYAISGVHSPLAGAAFSGHHAAFALAEQEHAWAPVEPREDEYSHAWVLVEHRAGE